MMSDVTGKDRAETDELVYAAAVLILSEDLYPRKLEIIREYIQNASDALDDYGKIADFVEDHSVLDTAWDRIYVTTLFSFEFARIAQSIDFALEVANGDADKVFVGGIAASLMHERFAADPRWIGIRFIRGLLDKAPAKSLQLDDFSEELYSDDIEGTPIEDLIPDYSILDQVSYRYPVRDAYFIYASRGCIRSCSFCGVPKLEGGQRDTTSIGAVVRAIDELYGVKKDLTIMDNNIVASPRFHEMAAIFDQHSDALVQQLCRS